MTPFLDPRGADSGKFSRRNGEVMGKHGSHWIGFDLGGTKMQAVLYDEDFKARGSVRKKTKGHEGTRAGLERMVEVIRTLLDETGVERKEIAGIGVGCAGPLDLEKGVILEAPNLGWRKAPVRETLEEAFKCPAVIANDVDAGTFGEFLFGAGKKARCVVGVFPGTGIGGGCVYEGKLLRGRTSSCMEIGHVGVMPDGPVCGCGQKGCLEAVASRLAVAQAAAAAAYRGEAPWLLSEAGTDLAKIRSGVIAESIERGEVAIERIVRRAAFFIGRACATVVNLIAPDVIVLGGGLVEAMPKIYAEEVEKGARAHVMSAYREAFRVEVARLGDDATALGAAAWARASIE